MLYWW